MPTAFITGCASGFGHRLAKQLLDRGWHVVATDPEPHGLEAALGGPSDHSLVLKLDVRDRTNIAYAVAAALDWQPIDLLVNNGGYAIFGTQEDADLDAIRDMFEVNVFGLGAVTQALLPSLRSQKGMIINVSSIAGRMVFPESGWYAASKHAVEALSAALWQECKSFGVRVRVIEPGSFATRFGERAAQASKPRDEQGPYSELFPEWDMAKQEALELPQNPDRVVAAMLAAIDETAPFKRYLVGADADRILGHAADTAPDAWTRVG